MKTAWQKNNCNAYNFVERIKASATTFKDECRDHTCKVMVEP